MKRGIVVLVGALAITAALLWWLRGVQRADTLYVPHLTSRAWAEGGPVVTIDEGHWNLYTAEHGYAPFARLLAADGYTLFRGGNVADPEVLGAANVVVVANALGFRGVVRQAGQILGFHLDGLGADAFTDAEANRLEEWVRQGGSLLLVADHAPAGRALQSVAERFGVTMHDGFVYDPEQSEAGDPSFIVFTRANRTLGPHPIIDGQSPGEAIQRVVTFAGQALDGPAHATKLLMFSGTAYHTSRPNGSLEDRIPVAGLGQALAMTHGRGRVVVVGEAALLTAQVISGGGTPQRIGLTWPNADNERFVRQVMRWLSHAGD